jgi:hypothetical protein
MNTPHPSPMPPPPPSADEARLLSLLERQARAARSEPDAGFEARLAERSRMPRATRPIPGQRRARLVPVGLLSAAAVLGAALLLIPRLGGGGSGVGSAASSGSSLVAVSDEDVFGLGMDLLEESFGFDAGQQAGLGGDLDASADLLLDAEAWAAEVAL